MIRCILFIITFLAASVFSFANDDIFHRPSVQSLVIDNANIFTEQQRMLLNVELSKFVRNTSVQFWIYTTTDLHGYDIAEFGQRLGQGWSGENGADKWIIIVYKPTTETCGGGVTIQTSQGIDKLIPEKTRNRIVDQEMMPLFRKGRVYEGIDKAVDVCVQLGNGELKASDYSHPKKKAFLSFLWKLFLLLALLAVISVFLVVYSKRSYDARIEDKRNSKEYNRKEKRGCDNKLSPKDALYFGNDDEPNPEKVKEETEIRNRKRRIVSVVLIAASLGCIFWSLIVMNQYVKVPATVTSVSSQKNYGVFSSLGRVYRTVSEYVTWNITLRYYYNDAVYSVSFKMEGYNGQHLMIYCNKHNPQKCLPSLIDYWIILGISFVCLVLGLKFFPNTRGRP